jgi:hypothetical protein
MVRRSIEPKPPVARIAFWFGDAHGERGGLHAGVRGLGLLSCRLSVELIGRAALGESTSDDDDDHALRCVLLSREPLPKLYSANDIFPCNEAQKIALARQFMQLKKPGGQGARALQRRWGMVVLYAQRSCW